MDLFAPSDVDAASASWRLVANTLSQRSPVVGTVRTAEKIGDAWAVNLKWPPFNDQSATIRRRSRLLAWAARHRGQANRSVLGVPGYQAPSWAPELLSNNRFDGTTGWAVGGAQYALSAQDRVARFTRTAVTTSQDVLVPNAAATVVAFAPYAARVMEIPGRGTFTATGLQLGTSSGAQDIAAAATANGGLKTLVGMSATTSMWFGLLDSQTSALIAGDYYESPYVSLARCALVDNSPNAFQRSDTIGVGGYWTATGLAGISDDAVTAPDGTTTGDRLTENSSASQHNISRNESRSSVAEDWCISAMVKRGSGTRNFGLVIGRDGSNHSRAIFDLTAGTVQGTASSGDNTNPRAFIVNKGDGWYECHLVARLAASTNVLAQAEIVDGGNVSYTGDGTSQLSLWRLGAARSSVPFRVGQTTTAATSGTTQPSTGINLKGLPPSTNGLALEGYWCDVNLQLNRFVAELRSDAAGLGYAQFVRPFRTAPSDNAPVVFHNPMGRFLLEANQIAWDDLPGLFSTLELPFIEDIAA